MTSVMVWIDFDEESLDSYKGVGVAVDGAMHFYYFESGDPEVDFQNAVVAGLSHDVEGIMASSSVDAFVMCRGENGKHVWGFDEQGFITKDQSRWRSIQQGRPVNGQS